MSNGINARQNEPNSLAMLAAQRNLYTVVNRIDNINFILSVFLPLVLAVIQGFGAPWSWVRFCSYGLALIMLVLSLVIKNTCKKKKALAASIQLKFDTYVFQMPWDQKLFGKEKNLNAEIADNSAKVLADEKEKNKLQDWYTPLVDSLPLEKGILACQRENYHWDAGLRKRYRTTAIIAVGIIIVGIFVLGIARNESAQELILRFIFVAPMLSWLFSLLNDLREDNDRLKELDEKINSSGTKQMDDLLVIEKDLTEHRKSAVKIPDLIYNCFKDNDEDKEHRIVELEIGS